jgi:hypothetical protein
MAYRSEKGNFDGITAEYLATYGLTWDEDAGATYGKGKGLWTLTTSETDATATLTMTNDDTGALGDITMTIASDGSVTWGGSCVYKPS